MMVDSFDLEATHFQIRSERVIEAHSGSRAFGIRIRAHWQIPGIEFFCCAARPMTPWRQFVAKFSMRPPRELQQY